MTLLGWLPAISDVGDILSLERPSIPLELHSVLLAGELGEACGNESTSCCDRRVGRRSEKEEEMGIFVSDIFC